MAKLTKIAKALIMLGVNAACVCAFPATSLSIDKNRQEYACKAGFNSVLVEQDHVKPFPVDIPQNHENADQSVLIWDLKALNKSHDITVHCRYKNKAMNYEFLLSKNVSTCKFTEKNNSFVCH